MSSKVPKEALVGIADALKADALNDQGVAKLDEIAEEVTPQFESIEFPQYVYEHLKGYYVDGLFNEGNAIESWLHSAFQRKLELE